jgi:electron transport complex protein RnfC
MVFEFRGGAKIAHQKHLTAGKPIEPLPMPQRLYLHTRQHLGAPAVPVVAKGDRVGKGQLIAEARVFVSAPVHAPTSGVILDVTEHRHPTLGKGTAIVLEPDGEDTWCDGIPNERDWKAMTPDAICERVRDGGLVGLGGASFPTHVKLTPPSGTRIETVLINGAECEPYLTSDDAAMRARPEDVVIGLEIILKAVGARDAAIGIERNKPEALAALTAAAERLPSCRVVSLPTRYPQGAERSLIQAILGKWVPAGKLPMAVGVVVQNAATTIALADAVTRGLPLLDRVVTVSGLAVRQPRNVRTPLGATWTDLLEFCGGTTAELARLIMGGPMMGIAQNHFDTPVVKATSGLLALTRSDIARPETGPCIRCGSCVEACPMGLAPLDFTIYARERDWEAAEQARTLECVECGSCEYSCPANRPLVASVRVLKALIGAAKAKENARAKAS